MSTSLLSKPMASSKGDLPQKGLNQYCAWCTLSSWPVHAPLAPPIAASSDPRRHRWSGLGTLGEDGFRPSEDADAPCYIGVGGMGAIADALSGGLDIRQDVWVSPNGGIYTERESGEWRVKESKSVHSRFDAVVIAHKCAPTEPSALRVPAAPSRHSRAPLALRLPCSPASSRCGPPPPVSQWQVRRAPHLED